MGDTITKSSESEFDEMSSIPSFCRQIDFTQGDVIWFIFPPSPLITSLKMCDQNLGRLITWYDKDQWIYSITCSMDVVHHTTERHKLALNLKQVYVMYLFYLISRLFQNWSCAEPRSSWDRILLQSEYDLQQRCNVAVFIRSCHVDDLIGRSK